MFKVRDSNPKVDLGLGLFFILLSAVEFITHNSVMELVFGSLFLLVGVIRFISFFKRNQK